MSNKIKVKDKLLDDTLDLSCCDLKEVPVKEIAVLRRAAIVDLSNNDLVTLPKNFINLKQIIKLDLSKNNLIEIPENFGELVQLKHLDLYSNQISRLPLSLANLKNLRWLDLKENPLTPAVASVAGPCSNAVDCQNCARNVVNYLSKVKRAFEEAERLKKEAEIEESSTNVPKKENQKKKKKKSDKDKDAITEIKCQRLEKNNTKSNKTKNKSRNPEAKKGGLVHFLCSAFLWLLFVTILAIIIIPFLPNSREITDFVKEKTGLPIQHYQLSVEVPPIIKERVQIFINYPRFLYENYFKQNSTLFKKN